MSKYSNIVEIREPRATFAGNANVRDGRHPIELIPKVLVTFPECSLGDSLLQFDARLTVPNGDFLASDECEVRALCEFCEQVAQVVGGGRKKALIRGAEGSVVLGAIKPGDDDLIVMRARTSMPFGRWQRNVLNVILEYGEQCPSTMSCAFLSSTTALSASGTQMVGLIDSIKRVFKASQ